MAGGIGGPRGAAVSVPATAWCRRRIRAAWEGAWTGARFRVLTWDSDNNVTSLTEPNGGQATWAYDPNAGYPLTTKGARANHDGAAGTTFAYQAALSGHIADLTAKLTPQQRLWAFGYDSNGDVTSVTKPPGNVSGAVAGSIATT